LPRQQRQDRPQHRGPKSCQHQSEVHQSQRRRCCPASFRQSTPRRNLTHPAIIMDTGVHCATQALISSCPPHTCRRLQV
jgi:hypothetical protein